jgi:hypothetical protein
MEGASVTAADVDPVAANVIGTVVPHYVPPRPLALYARWWQLETWLRELAYVELRARSGTSWGEAVGIASARKQADAAFSHMAGADNKNPLAYLDYSQLLKVLEENWSHFGYALLEPRAWAGRQYELRQIRHRIGHMRRPHADDLDRLEQTLRDLERGTFIAIASYNRRFEPSPTRYGDPVTQGWVRAKHPTARRLIAHAERQYETRILVRVSRRPWAELPESLDRASGIFWHIDFSMRDRSYDPRTLWHDSALASVRPLAVHMLADDPYHVSFTFSARDLSIDVAEAIGSAFDAVLMVSRHGRPDEEWGRWQQRARTIDFRLLSGTAWNIVDESTLPISNFAAGGGVEALPDW